MVIPCQALFIINNEDVETIGDECSRVGVVSRPQSCLIKQLPKDKTEIENIVRSI